MTISQKGILCKKMTILHNQILPVVPLMPNTKKRKQNKQGKEHHHYLLWLMDRKQ